LGRWRIQTTYLFLEGAHQWEGTKRTARVVTRDIVPAKITYRKGVAGWGKKEQKYKGGATPKSCQRTRPLENDPIIGEGLEGGERWEKKKKVRNAMESTAKRRLSSPATGKGAT